MYVWKMHTIKIINMTTICRILNLRINFKYLNSYCIGKYILPIKNN